MKKKHHEDEELVEETEELDYAEKAAELEKSTKEVEAEKLRKKHAREERKFLKEQAQKRQKLERLIAPLLLLATLLISYLVWQLS